MNRLLKGAFLISLVLLMGACGKTEKDVGEDTTEQDSPPAEKITDIPQILTQPDTNKFSKLNQAQKNELSIFARYFKEEFLGHLILNADEQSISTDPYNGNNLTDDQKKMWDSIILNCQFTPYKTTKNGIKTITSGLIKGVDCPSLYSFESQINQMSESTKSYWWGETKLSERHSNELSAQTVFKSYFINVQSAGLVDSLQNKSYAKNAQSGVLVLSTQQRVTVRVSQEIMTHNYSDNVTDNKLNPKNQQESVKITEITWKYPVQYVEVQSLDGSRRYLINSEEVTEEQYRLYGADILDSLKN